MILGHAVWAVTGLLLLFVIYIVIFCVFLGDIKFSFHCSSATSAEARPMLLTEDIKILNISQKNNVGLSSSKFFAQFGGGYCLCWREWGVSLDGNRSQEWSVWKNNPRINPVVRMSYTKVEVWLLSFFVYSRDHIPFYLSRWSLSEAGYLNRCWYGCAIQGEVSGKDESAPGTLIHSNLTLHGTELKSVNYEYSDASDNS